MSLHLSIDADAELTATDLLTISRHELVIIDAAVGDYQQLVDDLLFSDVEGRDVEILLLDGSRDGIDQISEALAG